MKGRNGMDWIKSSFSNGSGGNNCVEVAALDDGARLVRDSKRPNADRLLFTPAEWDAFIRGVKAGEFE